MTKRVKKENNKTLYTTKLYKTYNTGKQWKKYDWLRQCRQREINR